MSNDRTGAERVRRYRERKRAGVVCMVQLSIFASDIEALVRAGRLLPADQKNRQRIAEVAELLIDDFTQGKLASAGAGL